MAGFEHLLKSYDVSDTLDDIASADPPAYLRRCFAEGLFHSQPVVGTSAAACALRDGTRLDRQ